MKPKTYTIKEAFYTLQGEGVYVGTPVVLIRFSGCNIWSGNEKDRVKSAPKGMCALWCDTDFKGTNGENGGKYTSHQIVELVMALTPRNAARRFVMLTGGEPMLQIDHDLLYDMLNNDISVLIETNGSQDVSLVDTALFSVTLTDSMVNRDPRPHKVHITVSPKPPAQIHPSLLTCKSVGCLKLVYDESHIDPSLYATMFPNTPKYLQPVDYHDEQTNEQSRKNCISYVLENPIWSLCTQNHKIWGLP